MAQGTVMDARALVTHRGSREAFLATLMLCSDGSRDGHGRAGTGDASWLEGSISGDADAVLGTVMFPWVHSPRRDDAASSLRHVVACRR